MSSPTTPSHVVDPQRLQPFFDQINSKADRINTGFVVGFFFLGLALSLFYQTWSLALMMGGGSLLIYLLVRTIAPRTLTLRLVTSFLYWNYGVQFLMQMHGMYEMKFIFFIALTVLLFYEDWRVVLPATGYALITLTLLFAYRESVLVQTYFSQSQDLTVTHFVIHCFSVLFYAALCMWWAKLQHDQTRESAISAIKMEEQLHMVDVNMAFADGISGGNLKEQYGSDSPDKLGTSLLHMRESLVKATQREEREKFATVGLARIGEILRQNSENLQELGDKVIEEVVRYMKANQGFIFVKEGEDEETRLELLAARAWERKKFMQKTLQPGEGLVGQAALEKQTIYLTDVPNNYIHITSGLGQANPRSILIVPLKSEDQVIGVIELASFERYETFEIQFLEKVGESIASTVLSARNNQRNKSLLEQSRLLAEQMRSQEEEIRQNMEEMQATQEEMQRKNQEIERLLNLAKDNEQSLKEKLEEIQKVQKESERKNKEMLEYMENYKLTLLRILDQLPHKIFLKDENGRMVLVNTVVAKAHNLTVDELVGKSDFDFVDHETATQWRNQELDIIRKGSETYIFNEDISGETVTLKSTKMAFYIPHLKQTGLLGIQTDITELQKLKARAKEPVQV